MSDMLTKLEDVIIWAVTTIAGAAVAGVSWLVRVAFTNKQEIALMRSSLDMFKADLEHRTRQHEEDRERFANIERDISSIREFLMEKR